MKSPSSVDALRVLEQHDPAAVLGHPVVAALEVPRLADHDRADAELAQQPAAVPARRERGDHDAVGVVAAPTGGAEGGRLGVHRGVAVLDPAVVAAPEQGPVLVEQRGADRDAALGEAVASLCDGDLEHSRASSPSSSASTRDLCSEGRVMSTTADRTYTTTVGSQEVELPLVPLNDELTIALLIMVDMGVSFAQTAGCELAELMRPAEPEIVVSVATMGIPFAIEASRALGLDDYVILHKTPKIHLGESWSESVCSITTDAAPAPSDRSGPGRRRAAPSASRSSTT